MKFLVVFGYLSRHVENIPKDSEWLRWYVWC